jgi:hypothetical protein
MVFYIYRYWIESRFKYFNFINCARPGQQLRNSKWKHFQEKDDPNSHSPRFQDYKQSHSTYSIFAS